jgi:hypothetical protein
LPGEEEKTLSISHDKLDWRPFFIFLFTVEGLYHKSMKPFYALYDFYITSTGQSVSRKSGEEDLGAHELLRRGYSAGPVSQTFSALL